MEDKQKVNYPYEFSETITVPINNPDYSKFKNHNTAHNFPISKHYKEKVLYSERINKKK
ncbi:hypothetical protein ACO1D2_21625 [Bacillus thuringiensis]|uniref:hypothetical protein n=1 Tax=Bacillus cereus group TaxID=86661 RepID=UPI003304C9DF|nr:hypothetical protein [Bacillus cereus]HDR8117327.1 hypothetical protein [Bacillus cereus]